MNIRLIDTVGGKAGPNENNLDDLQFHDPADPMDEPLPAFAGDKEVAWNDGYSKNGHIMYVNDQPLPATVAAFLPQLVTQDR